MRYVAPPLSGLLHGGNAGLHRAGGLHADRIQQALRLVESGRHHVRDADW